MFGNLGGAVLTFVYFREVDPIAGGVRLGGGEMAFFALGFSLLSVVGRIASARWMRPITQAGLELPTRAEDSMVRRRVLLMPAFMALLTFTGWAAAGLLWGVLWPLLAGASSSKPHCVSCSASRSSAASSWPPACSSGSSASGAPSCRAFFRQAT